MTTVFFKFRRSVRVELIHKRNIVHIDKKFHSIHQALQFLHKK